MKPSQLAKGFKARPDTTSSEKRTALDRLNAIDGIVDIHQVGQAAANGRSSAFAADDQDEVSAGLESDAYRAWRRANRYTAGQVIDLPLKAIKPSPFNPRHFYLKTSIAELAVNLAKQGQQQAIHVIPDYESPGMFFVSDG